MKIFSGGGACAPRPYSKAHGFAPCKFPNLKKKNSCPPPLPNPGDAPAKYSSTSSTNKYVLKYYSLQLYKYQVHVLYLTPTLILITINDLKLMIVINK